MRPQACTNAIIYQQAESIHREKNYNFKDICMEIVCLEDGGWDQDLGIEPENRAYCKSGAIGRGPAFLQFLCVSYYIGRC